MGRNIDSLLKKKGWSGKEVGKALVASIVHDIKHQNEPDYKPLFSQADFDKMENSLNTERDYIVYGCYRAIYSSLIDTYNRGQAIYQQFYNGYSRYLNTFIQCQNSDNALEKASDYPLIMTESQYNRYKVMAKEQLEHYTESYYSIIFNTLRYFRDNPTEAPENIKTAIEATKKQPATNKRILGAYNKDYGIGYYQLSDGRRSDQMSEKEWEKTLQELYLSTHKLTINGEPATIEETIKHYNNINLINGYKLFYEGIEGIKKAYKEVHGEPLGDISEAEEVNLLETLENMLGILGRVEQERKKKAEAPLYPLQDFLSRLIDRLQNTSIEWHYYTEPPTNLTKYDILTDCLDHYSGAYLNDVDKKQQFTEFKKDYPELYKAIVVFAENSIPALNGLKSSQFFKDIINWGELADLNFINYRTEIIPNQEDIIETYRMTQEDTAENYTKSHRIAKNGVAIIQDPSNYQLEDNGDYKETSYPLFVFQSLDSIAQNEREQEEIRAFRERLFEPALKYLYSFNALMKIIAKAYDIDGMETVQQNTAILESQIDGYNGMLYMFYTNVYGSKTEKKRKRELIKTFFEPIELEKLKPTEETVKKVTTDIERLGFNSTAKTKLKDLDIFIEQLMKGVG